MAIGHLSRLISLQQIPITGQWQGEMPELNGGVHRTIIYRWGIVHCYVWLLKANRCDSNRINLLLHKWQYVWAINSPCAQICPLIIHPGKEFPSFLFLLSSVIVLTVFDCRGNKGFSLPHVTKSFVDLIFSTRTDSVNHDDLHVTSPAFWLPEFPLPSGKSPCY